MKNYDEYKTLRDVEIIEKIEKGDVDALDYIIEKYDGKITKLANKYNLKGYSKEDNKQEMMIVFIGLLSSYDPTRGTLWNYAKNSMVNKMKDLYRKQKTRKHGGDRQFISLDGFVNENADDRRLMIEVIDSGIESAEENVFEKYSGELMKKRLKAMNLPEIKYEVLECRAMGMTYKEISAALDVNGNFIYNTLRRFRTIFRK